MKLGMSSELLRTERAVGIESIPVPRGRPRGLCAPYSIPIDGLGPLARVRCATSLLHLISASYCTIRWSGFGGSAWTLRQSALIL